MSRIILFPNQKGGIGKSTDCRELGWLFSNLGHNLLYADCDSQGNLSKSFNLADGPGVYEALTTGEINIRQIKENLSILTGDFRLSLLEKSLIGEIDAFTRLKDLLAGEAFAGFDFIFVDTPPSLGVMTCNALTSADHFCIPMNSSLYSLQGTNDLLNTVAKIRRTFNPGINLVGVIMNSFDSRPVIARQIKAEILEAFGDAVIQPAISRTIKMEEAIAAGVGIVDYTHLGKCRAKEEITAIGNELLRRLALLTAEQRFDINKQAEDFLMEKAAVKSGDPQRGEV